MRAVGGTRTEKISLVSHRLRVCAQNRATRGEIGTESARTFRASDSLSHGTPGERAGERGRLIMESKCVCILMSRDGPALTVSSRTHPLSPALSPEYRDEGVCKTKPSELGQVHRLPDDLD